jgi:hypothetical protein
MYKNTDTEGEVLQYRPPLHNQFVKKTLGIVLVLILLGDSPASEFLVPAFRNTLSVPSS